MWRSNANPKDTKDVRKMGESGAQPDCRDPLPRRSAAWKSDSMYNRYTIASEADLRDGVRRLGRALLPRLPEEAKLK